jgi:hypothetical protein
MLNDEQLERALPRPWPYVDDRACLTASQLRVFSIAIEAAAVAELRAELERVQETLQFVERWANHHGAKPHMTPQEALSCIQHYPGIVEITQGYADGKVPDTPNPWAELAKVQAERDELLAVLPLVAPEEPMNQDEMGGCVWCGGTPPGEEHGYAGADPAHHEADCGWITARAAIARTEGEKT